MTGVMFMALLEILKDEHPVLHKQAKAVKKFDDELRQLAEDMMETMKAAPGIGLAAPQVGVSRRLIVVCDAEDENAVYAVANPKIMRREGELVSAEGCLSVPHLIGDVKRAVKIHVKGQDVYGKPFSQDAEGLLARVYQHELDHLNGILILDRAEPGTVRPAEEEKEEENGEEKEDAAPHVQRAAVEKPVL